MQQFGHNRHGPKIGGCAPLGGAGSPPHLTQCGGAEAYLRVKFHIDPHNRLATIHQRHRQTDRQTDRDRQTDTDRQRSHSILRTILQTVAEKVFTF